MNVICTRHAAASTAKLSSTQQKSLHMPPHHLPSERPIPSTLQELLTPGLRPLHRPVAQTCEVMVAHVQDVGIDGFIDVDAPNDRRLRVAVAVGCLVQPEPGDLVQVFATGTQGWITMVLRRDGEPTTVVLSAGPHAIEMRAPHLTLNAADRLNLRADRIEQRATLIETASRERNSETVLMTSACQR